MIWNEARAAGVAADSAGLAWNVHAEIATLPPSQGYQRLYDLFHTALLVYSLGRTGWGLGPEPCPN